MLHVVAVAVVAAVVAAVVVNFVVVTGVVAAAGVVVVVATTGWAKSHSPSDFPRLIQRVCFGGETPLGD